MPTARLKTPLAAAGVGLVTAVLFVSTEPFLAIGWDEGYTLGREARLRDWFRALAEPAVFASRWQRLPPDREMLQADQTTPPRRSQLDTPSKLLSERQVLEWFWPFAREEPHGHPPFYALLGLVGDLIAPSWQVLPRARLGPILLFALTSAVVFDFVRSRWGLWPAIVAASAWVFQPNLFGHGHYAAYDGILTALWLLTVVAFAQAVIPENPGVVPRAARRWLWSMLFGVILGLAAGTKFTGWFLPIPFLAWSALYRDRRGFVTVAVGLAIAAAVILAIMPPWWRDPIAGVIRFLKSNLTRHETIVIQIQFLGKIYYTPEESLPWYNTLVWTVFVTPVGFLVLGAMGIFRSVRCWRVEPAGILLVGHWTFLMLLRALPHTPGHDGVRLFLPAFGVLALLCGLGSRVLVDRWAKWSKIAFVAAILEGIVSVAVMMPVPLAYFSPLIGGLPGATALGMEPTYYWDALGSDARKWLADHTAEGETITFATFPHSWLYLRSTGGLPERLAPLDRGTPKWYVLQNRPGMFSPLDRALIARATPAYTVTKLSVPLIWVFPYQAVEEWKASRGR